MTRIARLKVGDVFELDTPRGKAYIQYASHNDDLGELIRVLPGVYDTKPQNLLKLVNGQEEYFVHFPVKASKKQKIIELVSNFELPIGIEIPKYFRTEITDKNGNVTGWHIVDYDSWQRDTIYDLSAVQKKMSPWGIWNDTLLIERISLGWNLNIWC